VKSPVTSVFAGKGEDNSMKTQPISGKGIMTATLSEVIDS